MRFVLTCWTPPPCPAALQYNCVQPKTSIDDAMEEAKMVTCGAIEGLLKKQGKNPSYPYEQQPTQ